MEYEIGGGLGWCVHLMNYIVTTVLCWFVRIIFVVLDQCRLSFV